MWKVEGSHEVPSKAEEVLVIMTASSGRVSFPQGCDLSVALYALIPIHIQVALCGFSAFKIKEHKKL